MGWSYLTVQDGPTILCGDSSRNTVVRRMRITLTMTICICRLRPSVCYVTNMRTRGEYRMTQLKRIRETRSSISFGG